MHHQCLETAVGGQGQSRCVSRRESHRASTHSHAQAGGETTQCSPALKGPQEVMMNSEVCSLLREWGLQNISAACQVLIMISLPFLAWGKTELLLHHGAT